MNVTGTLTHRESLGYWLNESVLLGSGVEVGSAAGQFAGRILSTWKGGALYLVDPWEKQHPNEYQENTNEVAPFEEWYAACLKLARDDPRAFLKRTTSVAAAKEFKNLELDFVYIDGNHDYGHVMADLDAWVPKVRPGGLVGGHDFYRDFEGGAFCDVQGAVLRWTREHNIVFSVTPCTSWWFIKG